MKSKLVGRAAIGLLMLTAVPGVAYAQWTPGSEIVGQSVQVTTNGITNTVYLDPGGVARIVSPAGNTVQGSWTAANGQLCLSAGGPSECWPYTVAVPGGTAGVADQQLQFDIDLAGIGDQYAAASAARRAWRTRQVSRF